MKNNIKKGWVASEPMSSADHIDWSKSVKMSFPNLKPSTTAISLRLPDSLLGRIRILAHKQDVPYQSLIKVLLDQAVEREFKRAA